MLRLAVVTQYFHPEDFRINDLVGHLATRGHMVQVLTGHPNYPSGRFFAGYGGLSVRREHIFGAHVVRVPMIARGNSSGARLATNYLTFAASATVFAPVLVRGPIDVVLAYQPSPVSVAAPALAIARVRQAAALMWVQDLWPQTLGAMGLLRSRPIARLANAATGLLHRKMDGLLIQSRGYAQPLEQQGVDVSRITYVPNWAEAFYGPVVVPDSAPERREIPSGFVVMFAGNLGEAQGLETLLDAATILRDLPALQWVILGEGRRLKWLSEEVRARGLSSRIHLLGRKPAESMPTWFALADVMLATLRPDPIYELTVPSKLQTYLACGRPIIASLDGEGARVIKCARAGEATPAGNAYALAAAVRRLYESQPHILADMGSRGLSYYNEHFRRETVIDRVERLLLDHAASRWQEKTA